MKTLLQVENLQTQFTLGRTTIPVIKGISFSLAEGEVLGLVGESGSGKTIASLSIMRLIEPPGQITGGKVTFNDADRQIDLLKQSDKELQDILGNRMAMIFQDAMTSLNPVLTIGFQIAETLRVHRRFSRREAKEKAIDLLEKVGIGRDRLSDYPHEFSGGMRQRVMIAMAIACEPKLLIADEPTTALDVTIQAQILSLLGKLRRELGMSMIFISHDLGVVAKLADRVAVMYAGKIVETASVKDIFERPQHPYTQALVSSIPRLGFRGERLATIAGAPPRLREVSIGCSFYPRCRYRVDICARETPVLEELFPGQSAACFVAKSKVESHTGSKPIELSYV
jgi:oligopeptide/dipeptide ABC transporter ATP-binding protein